MSDLETRLTYKFDPNLIPKSEYLISRLDISPNGTNYDNSFSWGSGPPSSYYRYEITQTFRSMWYSFSAMKQVQWVVIWLYNHCKSHKETLLDAYFEFCVEYHKSGEHTGYPHIHGTLYTQQEIKGDTLFNWSNALYRKWGRSSIYATNWHDKWHKNDHYEGPWSKYLLKEVEENNEANPGLEHYHRVHFELLFINYLF